MKAAVYRATGPAREVLHVEDLPVPEPGPGEVRVAVTLSGVNPTDWKGRAGFNGRPGPETFQVPHHDGAGRVDAVGPGVTGLAVGQRVWVFLAAFGNRYGTAAEFAVLPAERVVPLPDGASDELGACLGVPALTAAHCLGGDPAAVEGRTVLVAGGAGAVGHFAIELAKQAGARVVTTVSSPAKAELARAAGADLVLDYRRDDVVARTREAVGEVHRVVEVALGSNLEIDLAVLAGGGLVVVYAQEDEDPQLPTYRLLSANVSLRFVLLYGLSRRDLDRAVSWTSAATGAGALSPLPITPFPLDRIVDAHLAVEGGAVGKAVVRPGEPVAPGHG
ncbi:NADPH:quinone reductase [Trujillonella humicola]|uniref:NADPH:quinone reductase n=1 Tax=Trujillonella humicola TaxID=3383699 RepID=UPI003906C07B